MENNVIVSKENYIATITLNRPKSLNSMNDLLISELTSALLDVSMDENIRVVVLTGQGKGFCAGGDLTYLQSLESQIEARAFIKKVGNVVKIIRTMAKPIVCMVNGVAAGAGFNLAIACDIVMCASSARFSQSFSKVGLIPDCGGIYSLAKIVGTHKAKELMFSAELINSETALSLGIVNKVVADDQLEDVVRSYAQNLLQGAPLSLSAIKLLVNKSIDMDLETTLEAEADMQAILMSTEDYKEGVNAFLDKREAVFTGK